MPDNQSEEITFAAIHARITAGDRISRRMKTGVANAGVAPISYELAYAVEFVFELALRGLEDEELELELVTAADISDQDYRQAVRWLDS